MRRACPARRPELEGVPRPPLPARPVTDTSHGPRLAWPHVQADLAPAPRAASPLCRVPAARRVDVRRLRPARAPPGRAVVRALRRSDRPDGERLPRVRAAALVHDSPFRTLARGASAGRRRALEARRDLTGAAGRGIRRPRAAAPERRGAR